VSLLGYIDNYYARTLQGERDYAMLDTDIEVDVCVIGGGLAGINTALGLAERGKTVALIESRRLGWAASGRNGGFVDKGYAAGEADLAGKIGLEAAQGLVELSKNARGLIKKRIADFGIGCGPVIDGVLNVSMRDNPEKIKRYIDAANRDFDLGYEFRTRDDVRALCKSDSYYDGFFSPHDFQFNPLAYEQGLARTIVEKGGRLFENTPAKKIERDGAGWKVTAPAGTVKAKDIVLCCSISVGGLDRRLSNASFPVKTYVMVTQPLDEDAIKSALDTRYAIYETRFACNYYRRLEGNRILWGGRVALGAAPHSIADAMLHDMLEIYPQLKGKVKPETAWSGLLCYAPHKMPQIGKFEDGYWYNTAFGGHGLCGTTVGGEVIAAAIASGDRAYEKFSPFRPFFAGGKIGRYAAEMVYFWWRARDYLGI
jgi:gamma-glutamylputrescine oxidase